VRDRTKVVILITNRKWHTPFQVRRKSSTLNDLEGQYCNRNCIGCSASSLATAGLLVRFATASQFGNENLFPRRVLGQRIELNATAYTVNRECPKLALSLDAMAISDQRLAIPIHDEAP